MTEDEAAIWCALEALLNDEPLPATYCPLDREIQEWPLRRTRADDLTWLDTDEDEI